METIKRTIKLDKDKYEKLKEDITVELTVDKNTNVTTDSICNLIKSYTDYYILKLIYVGKNKTHKVSRSMNFNNNCTTQYMLETALQSELKACIDKLISSINEIDVESEIINFFNKI